MLEDGGALSSNLQLPGMTAKASQCFEASLDPLAEGGAHIGFVGEEQGTGTGRGGKRRGRGGR
eukprot:8454070-Karenia_brevis.AAC.1